jgi:hypothetical protein
MKDKLNLLNVSGRNNNCFYNAIYLLVKDNFFFKQNIYNIKNGTELRKYLSGIFVYRYYKKFKTYLQLAQDYLKEGMIIEDISQLLSVNITEIESLINANIMYVNLNNIYELQNLLKKHFYVTGRMPSEPEMSSSIDYIKKIYKIVVLPILLNSNHEYINRGKTLDIINRYNYGKKNFLKYDIDLLTTMKIDIQDARIITKIRNRIADKFNQIIKKRESSRMLYGVDKYNYGIIITDMTHYQLLKINRKIVSSSEELGIFIYSYDNSFTISQESIRSRSRIYK